MTMSVQASDRGRAITSPEEFAAAHRTLPAARYDLVIAGAGSAGFSGVSVAQALGERVAQLDHGQFGGDCLYSGCVPSKTLLHVAHTLARTRRAEPF